MDYSDPEFQAIHHVFPDTEKYLCYFHVEQAWLRWTKQKKNNLSDAERESLLSLLRKTALAPTRDIHQNAMEQLTTSDPYTNNQKVKTYLDNFWLNIPERWCRVHFHNGFHLNVTTNNGVEALNNSLKKFYIKLTSTGTLTSLIDILVTEFVPDLLKTYVQLNYQFCSQYKRYNEYVPEFLHNKPRNVVKHCLTRYANASSYKAGDIDFVTNGGVFLVKSESNVDEFYHVDIGSNLQLPSCSCADFIQSYLPCKHMFAIFRNTNYKWNDLSPLYLSSPYMNLDDRFLSEQQFDQDLDDHNAIIDFSEDLQLTAEDDHNEKYDTDLSKKRKIYVKTLKFWKP
ncbi:hypothetical protein ScPMuIL_008078 [Solemya velum]